ncbi:hypothetical protein BDZ94DRAFT_707255 [Collybia nuda]|uniref:Transcription factor tau subunit sfc6 n=1 Tax=Collybia nuda TaxID=64659 RepID=A0A9P5Y3E5_9AGAR|nr:hypothetical protein BDZ94DRAFT_707255 [Collybia nuda]
MKRSLRPRISRPSYAAMAGMDEDEDVSSTPVAGPSTKRISVYDEEDDSGSDFAPEKHAVLSQGEQEDNEDEAMNDPEADEGDDDDFELSNKRPQIRVEPTVKPKVKQKSLTKASRTEAPKLVNSGPSIPRGAKRQMYVLPAPSVHHRHRAVPLYSRMGRVERLASRPSLFKPYDVIMSNNFTQNPKVTDRINRAWGYNVGCGPLWELVEDRGWYKEAIESIPDMDREEYRRPVVYQNIGVKSGWEILSQEHAASYLPTDITMTEDGNLKPPPPVSCLFGPIEEQVQLNFKMFQTHKISDLMPESLGYVFNAGAPVWGLDWCPVHPSNRPARSFKQYLAVAPFPTRSYSPEIGVRVQRPSNACIQIWTLSSAELQENGTESPSGKFDQAQIKCEMVLCIEGGPAHELKWCPLPAHDIRSDSKRPRKLGLIAGTFEDGSLSIYAVPDPADIIPENHHSLEPVCVKLPEPLLRIELEETSCWTFDWANSELIAIGTTNGIIAVYDIGPSLKSINSADNPMITDLIPTHYITVHQSAIRALAWIRAPPCWGSGLPRTDGDPTVLASGGYDGMECMTDIREGHGSVMNRTRDVINAMAFSPFGGGPVTIDHENIVKAYSASPSMLGRGHTLLEPQGPVWSVSASDYHPQLAVGSADGSCMTTNSLRSTRRGGSVPFFVHKIYQMDYSRNSGLFRMLEQFLPQETQDRPAAVRVKTNEAPKSNVVGTGAWPSQVGVHRVTWNSTNGLAAASLLASATASGLCRVDELWGRWIKGKIPYTSVEHIRMELAEDMNVMDVDSDDSAASL